MFIMAPIISRIRSIGASWHRKRIVINLGINPVNGGIPLSDNNLIGISSCISGCIEFTLWNCVLYCWLK